MKNLNSEQAVDRLRKLLARAKDNASSEQEVNAAMKVARKIMDEYNLSESDAIQADHASQRSDDIMEAEAVSRSVGLDKLEKELAWVCADLLDVRWYRETRWVRSKTKFYSHGGPKLVKRESLVFYGYSRDVAIAQFLLPELFATIKAMSRYRLGSGWNKRHWDYCRGFVWQMRVRAAELRRQKPEATTSTSLVVLKDANVQRWAEENLHLKNGRKGRGMKINDQALFEKGKADGNEISLDTEGLTGGGKASSPKQIG